MKQNDLIDLVSRIFAKVTDGMLVTDSEGTINYANTSAELIFDWRPGELIGQPIENLMPADIAAIHHEYIQNYRSGQELGVMGSGRTVSAVKRDGSRIYAHISVTPVSLGLVKGFIAFVQNKTPEYELMEKMERLAFYCPDTGLLNRQGFERDIKEKYANIPNFRKTHYLTKIYIKNFDQLVRLYGEDAAVRVIDEAVSKLSAQLQDALVSLGRTRDDTISLLVNCSDLEEVTTLFEMIFAASGNPMEVTGNYAFLDAYFAITDFPDENTDLSTFLSELLQDISFYDSVDKVVILDAKYRKAIARKDALAHRLKSALIDFSGFEVFYQPKVSCQSQNIVSAEALVRWTDAELGNVSPAEFIPVAEELDLIAQLDSFVFDTVIKDCSDPASKLGKLASVSVNLSPLQLFKPNFVPEVLLKLEHSDLDPKRIEFEITESTTLFDVQKVQQIIHTLQETGIKISMDDFGTGYSSLAHLKTLPINILKIDQSFVRSMLDSEEDLAIVRTIITIAKALRLNIIAEGVETERHAEELIAMGCDMLQGYHYSKPVPKPDFNNLSF